MAAKIGYLELPAQEPERLAAFFERVFGWAATSRKWSAGSYLALDDVVGDVGCAVVASGPTGLRGPTPVVHVPSSDLRACLERISEAGGRVLEEPQRIDDYGDFARFEDCEGNVWGLWARLEEV